MESKDFALIGRPQPKPPERKVEPPVETTLVVAKPKRDSHANRAELWNPSQEDYEQIRTLSELGWPSPKIAEALGLTVQQFAGGIVRCPRIKEEIDAGVEACKTLPERQLAWRPMPKDLERVRELAADGLNEAAICSRLKVTRRSFNARLADTPQLKDAYEQGNGEYQAELLEQASDMLKSQDDALRHTSGLLIFKLKAHCGLTDKPDAKQNVVVEGTVKHVHSLNAPKPVAIQDVAEFARIEMDRAEALGREAMKSVRPAVVEAEVVNEQ